MSSGCSLTPTRFRPDHLPEPGHEFLTTGDPDEFVRLARGAPFPRTRGGRGPPRKRW